jgi:hypothetical protein
MGNQSNNGINSKNNSKQVRFGEFLLGTILMTYLDGDRIQSPKRLVFNKIKEDV